MYVWKVCFWFPCGMRVHVGGSDGAAVGSYTILPCGLLFSVLITKFSTKQQAWQNHSDVAGNICEQLCLAWKKPEPFLLKHLLVYMELSFITERNTSLKKMLWEGLNWNAGVLLKALVECCSSSGWNSSVEPAGALLSTSGKAWTLDVFQGISHFLLRLGPRFRCFNSQPTGPKPFPGTGP